MQITFWFDPACPFCWLTSRWLTVVAPQRDLQVDWRPISLLLKNEPAPDDPRHARLQRSHGMLRIIEAARSAGHEDQMGALYREFGRLIHHDRAIEADLGSVLRGLGLDPELAAAAEDPRWDDPIRASMDEAHALAGTEVGVPIIGFTTPDGRRVGLFGPVLTTCPTGDAALRLWDGVVAMAETDGFFELKRTRDRDPDLPPLATV